MKSIEFPVSLLDIQITTPVVLHVVIEVSVLPAVEGREIAEMEPGQRMITVKGGRRDDERRREGAHNSIIRRMKLVKMAMKMATEMRTGKTISSD